MIRVQRNGSDRIDIELSGKLDSEETKAALDALVSESEGVVNGSMLYRVEDFDLPTLGAIWVELKRLPELFHLLRRFDRAAILVDEGWLQTVSRIEGALIPGFEVKAFELREQAKAEAWLARP